MQFPTSVFRIERNKDHLHGPLYALFPEATCGSRLHSASSPGPERLRPSIRQSGGLDWT